MIQVTLEELPLARTLIADNRGESIFNVSKDYFMKEAMLFKNIISVTADEAPAIYVYYREIKSQLK